MDREVLPWLNFTVRFFIRMVKTGVMTGVMTMAVIMVLTKLFSQSDHNDFDDGNDFEESSSSFFP